MQKYQIEDLFALPNFTDVIFNAYIKKVNVISTRKDRIMAFVTVYDDTGGMEIILFPEVYEEYSDLLMSESLICIEGCMDVYEGETKVMAYVLSSNSTTPDVPNTSHFRTRPVPEPISRPETFIAPISAIKRLKR